MALINKSGKLFKRISQFELSPIPVLQHSITLSLLEIQNSTQSNLLAHYTQSLQLASYQLLAPKVLLDHLWPMITSDDC